MKLCIATSRDIGEKCQIIAKSMGYELTDMDSCDVFISVLYDKLIPEDYIKSRPCFNFHPGILPWYRGSGAYSWAIINGEFETGVTLHEIDKDIDHGDVIDIERFRITPQDTAESLFNKAEITILRMFALWLPDLLNGCYDATPQVEGKIYYRKDLEKAKDLTRLLRAFTFTGKENAFYMDGDKKVYLEYKKL